MGNARADDSRLRELRSRLLAEKGLLAKAAPPRIARREPGMAAPLSFAQQRLWFVSQLDPANPAYNMPGVVRIRGRWDEAALAAALAAIVRRHEVLRSVIVLRDGEPVQVVRDDLLPVWKRRSLDARPGESTAAALDRLADAEALRGFDLAAGPLLRTTLVRAAPDDAYLLITLHHIVFDGWSLGIFIRELAAGYEAAVTGRPASLAPLAIQYADFAVHQRGDADAGKWAADRDYWRRQLAGLPRLDFPTDRLRPPTADWAGSSVDFELTAGLSSALARLGSECSASLFMTLLAAFKVLLQRYTRQQDLAVGSPIANRNRRELEPLIGFFVNSLVLRTRLEAGLTFRQLLDRVKALTLAAYAHQDLPFEALVDELGTERDLSRHPLFQVVFVLQNAPTRPLALPGAELALLPRPALTAKFDLIVACEETPEGLKGTVEYSTALFERDTILRLVDHFRTLLESAVARPDAAIENLPMLPAAERMRMIELAGGEADPAGAADVGPQQTIGEAFAATAERFPEAIAVSCAGEHLTYRKLSERAEKLAGQLRQSGVGPESIVALAAERSMTTVVGILGILKAGGAYLPLDPAYPAERLEYMLQDSGATVLVTGAGVDVGFATGTIAVVRVGDGEGEFGTSSSTGPVKRRAAASTAAYVIYTSGSTGRPKGVVVTHANVLRLMRRTEPWFRFGPADVGTLYHSFAFDFSVWELWGPLLAGGRLVIVPFLTTRDFPAFHRLLCAEGVTILNQTPSAFRQVGAVDQASADAGRLRLRVVIFGGEALELSSLRTWIERHGDSAPELINMYGITETTVHVTYRRIRREDLARGAGSVIGVPIPDLQLHVLGPGLEPTPLGVAGELHVGGLGLARGYLHRPDLTADRFIPDPFGSAPGSRLYRSGDLARRRANGDLEYLGRGDDQIKIRGFRIELGEIEAALRRHPGVREVAAVVKGRSGGEPRLAAYFVAAAGAEPGAPELREFLRRSLPDYMVPADFVRLPALPLTGNGKLDRAALPDPESARLAPASTYAAPATPQEEILARVWGRVLGLERVGAGDNFFALGGDSILSIKTVAEIRRAGLKVAVEDLFRHQTVAELARVATIPADAAEPAALPAFALVPETARAGLPAGVVDAYPLTALQSGMVFHSEFDPGSAVFHDVFTQELQVPFDSVRFVAAWENAIARNPVLRTSFAIGAGSEPLQWVHAAVPIPVRCEDWSGLAPAERDGRLRRLFETRKRARFDWARPPFFAVHFHRLSPATAQFTIDFHHAILDGWSLASLLSAVFAEYLSAAPAPAPAELFRDFVALEQAARASATDRQFWRDQIAGAKFLRLPRPAPVPGQAKPRRAISTETVGLDDELSAGLRAAAAAAGVPLKTLLLSVHLRVMSALGGQRDVTTGVTLNGRPERVGGESALGLFLNTVPFRLVLRDEAWTDLARRTLAQEQAIQPHRRFPLADIQKVGGGDSAFETAFNFVHFHIYRDLLGRSDFAARGGEFYEETNFALIAHFSLEVGTSRVELQLKVDRTELGETQARRFAGYYRRCLEAVARAPADSVLRAALLPAEERDWQLRELNRTARDYPRELRLHERFEAQVRLAPDAGAVALGETQITYRELNRRANQLAHWLRSRGAGPGRRVALCLERSLEMVIGLLGILKCGAAYVPMDPNYPADRLAFMLRDSGAELLLVLGEVNGLPAEVTSVNLRGERAPWAAESEENPAIRGAADDPIYVIYTSGSTGQPKGAVVTHGGFANLVDWYGRELSLGPSDAVLLVSSFSFDLTQKNFFAPLIAGGRLELLPPGPFDPGAIGRLIARGRITLINCTPSAFYPVLDAAGDEWGQLATLRWAVLGGEPIARERVDPWLRSARCRAEIVNTYGPTECSDIAAFYRLHRGNLEAHGFVPTGRPIQNVALLIADEELRPVPTGVAGELCIAGEGVGLGYWGDAARTAARFPANPHPELSGPRIYLTGDLARYGEDGQVEYLGRLDDQVKIRGFRIELGEIEAALGACPGVVQAAVVARPDTTGTLRLIAYVVPVRSNPTSSEGLSSGTLQAFRANLLARLPDYMVPALWVRLDALPLSANGKVDRRALPEPPAAEPIPAANLATPAERTLAAIWSEVLRRGGIGAADSFFALGGDSILSLQVVAKARAAGLLLTARDVFEHRTLAELAAAARPANSAGAHPSQGEWSADGESSEVPLSPLQRWFFAAELAEPNHWNQAVMLAAREEVDLTALDGAVCAVIDRHEGLRTQFLSVNGDWIGRVVERTLRVRWPTLGWGTIPEAHPAYPEGSLHQLLACDARHVNLADLPAAIEAWANGLQASLDLGAGDLIRAGWLDLGPGRGGRLLLVIHHLVVDGVSWRILAEDLLEAYAQIRAGRTPVFPHRTRSFRAWCAALAASPLTEASAAEAAYWAALPDVFARLPVEFPGSPAADREEAEAVVRQEFSPAETRTLLAAASGADRPAVNDLLITALVRTFAGWTGRSSLWLDLEFHGRQEILPGNDVSRTIGWFTAISPVWLDLGGASDLGAALQTVRAQLRAVPREGLGFGLVSAWGQGPVADRLRKLPAPEIIFNYLGQFDQALPPSGIWSVAGESAGRMRGLGNRRSHRLQVVARVEGGRLRVEWSYSRVMHSAATIEALAGAYAAELRALLANPGPGPESADLALMDLRPDELDELMADL